MLEVLGVNIVVAIYKYNQFSARMTKARFSCTAQSSILFMDNSYMLESAGIVIAYRATIVRRAIIYQKDLKWLDRLAQNAVDASWQQSGYVVDRHHYGYRVLFIFHSGLE